MKQVVAVIDERTTVVCLHAAGQIRPVDEPFETLAGDFDYPPFHVHCRSVEVPWMAGFVNEQRAAANAELQTRPLKERRIGPNGPTGRMPPPPRNPPPAPVPAPAPPTPPALPGAKAALDEVPPAQVRDWLLAHPERFEVSGNGGGISETYWVRDVTTGQRFVLKAGQYHRETVNEVLGTRIGARLGLPGTARVAAGLGDGNGWVLLDHAEDVLPGHKVVGTGGSHGAIGKLAPRLADPKDPVRMLLHDFVIDEADAKGGNLLLLSADGGKTVRLVPIDRSLSMMGWRGAIEPGKTSVVAGDWSLAGRMKVADLRSYMKTRGSPKGVLDLVQDLAERTATRKAVLEAYDETLAALKALDLDDLTADLGGLADEAKTLIAHRIGLLETKKATILRQMGVTETQAVVAAAKPVLPAVDPAAATALAKYHVPPRSKRLTPRDWRRRAEAAASENRLDYSEEGPLQAKIAAFVAKWTGPDNEIDLIRDEIEEGFHDEVLAAAKVGPKAPTLYRGLMSNGPEVDKMIAGVKVGDEIDLLGLSSFTESAAHAELFVSMDTSMTIVVKDARGLPVAAISNTPHEEEWLLTGSLKVTKILRRVEDEWDGHTAVRVTVEATWQG